MMNRVICSFRFSEYIIINHPENLVRVPEGMKLEVAALLPTGGLTAYTAIMRARSYIRECEDRKGEEMMMCYVY